MDPVLDRREELGIEKVNQLVLFLSKDGRMDDIVESAKNKDYQKKLFKEYGLEKP